MGQQNDIFFFLSRSACFLTLKETKRDLSSFSITTLTGHRKNKIQHNSDWLGMI